MFSLELLHGTWVPELGKICIWAERNDMRYAPVLAGAQKTRETVTLLLPTYNKKVLPSLAMARHLDIAYPEETQITCEPHEQLCTALTPRAFKNMTIEEGTAEEDVLLAPDLLFWRNMIDHLNAIFDKNFYIPAISDENEPCWITAYPLTKELAPFMPDICCYSNGQYYDKESLLRHFSDFTVNDVAQNMVMPSSTQKVVEGSFLSHYCHQKQKTPFSKNDISDWMLWKSALDHEHHPLCFKLEAPDHAQKMWTLQCLLQTSPLETPVTLSTEWKSYLMDLGIALRIYPEFEVAFTKDNYQPLIPMQLSIAEAQTFLKETAWILQSAGFPVMIPSWYTPKGHQSAKLKLTGRRTQKKNAAETSFLSVESLMSFDVGLSLNGEDLTREEWQRLIDQKEELVYFRGQWVQLDLDHMQKMLQFWHINPSLDMNLLTLMDKASQPDIEFDEKTDEFMLSLYGKQNFEIYDEPPGLQGQLRDYQKRGYSWLRYMEQLGLNPCLADDMGLGKTVQIIALLLSDEKDNTSKRSNHASNLLVVPISVLGNWEKELARFAPQLKVMVYHSKPELEDLTGFKEADVVITTFSMIRRDVKVFQKMRWRRIVVDEAQNIKNPNATQTKALVSLKADHYLAVTGTPIENSLMDLWSLFHFLNGGYLGTAIQFKRTFHRVPENRDQLKRLVEPFILRRLKTDKNIISELPDKIEQKVYCQLTTEQAALYQNVVKHLEQSMKNTQGTDDKELSKMNMLATLTRLKQICNHPAQFLQDNSVFSKERSLKLQRLEEIVEEAIEREESVLIFSQYQEICTALHKELSKKYNTYLLHGGTVRTQRDRMIGEFQDPSTPPSLFILSLKAGGVGITLTKASQVIHFDRWWNPAVENQATDRAFRIGQDKKVLVHKFVTMGTLEEQVDQMIESKKTLSESILSENDDASWLKDLDANTFMDLIKLRKEAFSDGQ